MKNKRCHFSKFREEQNGVICVFKNCLQDQFSKDQFVYYFLKLFFVLKNNENKKNRKKKVSFLV